MENRVTPEKTPEQIQQEMTETRESLTEKVAALENQVVGTVQTAADTLTGTVEAVKSFVSTAPGAVTETVKQAADVVGEKMREVFDISGRVRAHPWAAVGVSGLLGCVTGYLLSGGRDRSSSGATASIPARAVAYPAYTAPEAPAAPSRLRGVFDEVISMVGRKVREVAENAINTATAAVNQTVTTKMPGLVDAAAEMATERLASGGDGAGGAVGPGDRFGRGGYGTGS